MLTDGGRNSRKPPSWARRTRADEVALEQGAYWDEAKANHVVKFTETFFRSQFVQGKLTLCEEQRRFLMSLYGWRLKDGRRRFRFANLHVPKKSVLPPACNGWGVAPIVFVWQNAPRLSHRLLRTACQWRTFPRRRQCGSIQGKRQSGLRRGCFRREALAVCPHVSRNPAPEEDKV